MEWFTKDVEDEEDWSLKVKDEEDWSLKVEDEKDWSLKVEDKDGVCKVRKKFQNGAL